MAKRKTPKIKNLGPDKITDDQLTKLQSLVRAINETQAEVGVIETRKHNLLHQVFEMQAHLSDLQKEFKEQYGDSDININDGTIKPKENEQVNS